jgi:hypothetical protein
MKKNKNKQLAPGYMFKKSRLLSEQYKVFDVNEFLGRTGHKTDQFF